MVAAILALVSSVVVGQASFQPFSGAWTAEFNGTTYVRLTLQATEGRLAGTISIGDSVHVDPRGEVDGVSAAPDAAKAIQEIRLADGVLSFSRKDGDDVDRFEVRLTGERTAELTLVLDEQARQELTSGGIPVPKPFRLTKAQ